MTAPQKGGRPVVPQSTQPKDHGEGGGSNLGIYRGIAISKPTAGALPSTTTYFPSFTITKAFKEERKSVERTDKMAFNLCSQKPGELEEMSH